MQRIIHQTVDDLIERFQDEEVQAKLKRKVVLPVQTMMLGQLSSLYSKIIAMYAILVIMLLIIIVLLIKKS